MEVQLYGEALCPYCMRFTTTIVAPLLKQGVGSIFNFTCEPVHVSGTCQACNGNIQLRQSFSILILSSHPSAVCLENRYRLWQRAQHIFGEARCCSCPFHAANMQQV